MHGVDKLDTVDTWGGQVGHSGCKGWTRWTLKESSMRENWRIGRRRDLDGVNEGIKDHGLDWGLF